MTLKTIDLNADVGEGAGYDAELMQVVSSVSIACGGHAGDDGTMRETLRRAGARGLTVGAHPGFADKENFGRERLSLSVAEIRAQIAEQVDRLLAIAKSENVRVRYVKLHGALANMAAEDEALAQTCFQAARACDSELAVMALANSKQQSAANALGMRVVAEAYADRAYTADGLLVSRREPGAVITDPDKVITQCLRLTERGEVVTRDGRVVASNARSICLHGDTPGALELASLIAAALKNAGIEIASAF